MATSKNDSAKKPAAKKGAGKGLAATVQPDAALAAVVGNDPMPRTEITKKLWDYIKANGLQDEKNRRNINADDKLLPVFGGKKQVTMFEMTSLVNKHMK